MLVRIMLVVGDELPQKLILKSQKIIGRADINKGGSRPGRSNQSRFDCRQKSTFFEKPNQFELIINIIENEIKFVDWIGKEFGYTYSKSDTGGFNEFLKENGRGLQYDLAFIIEPMG